MGGGVHQPGPSGRVTQRPPRPARLPLLGAPATPPRPRSLAQPPAGAAPAGEATGVKALSMQFIVLIDVIFLY